MMVSWINYVELDSHHCEFASAILLLVYVQI
jgi:hypothetical protein